MEDALRTKLKNINDDETTTGVLVTDKQGLCVEAIGNAKEESSGIISAIVELVAKLEPNKDAPQVILESDNTCCLIYSGKNINAAVFKNV